MKLTLQKIAFLVFAVLLVNTTYAQESEVEETVEDSPVLSFSGSVDTYFRTNLGGGSNDVRDGGTLAPGTCLLYTSPSPRDKRQSRMPSSA